MGTTTVEMTPEELERYNRYKEEEEKKQQEEKKKEALKTYKELVDQQIETAFPVLHEVSENLKFSKKSVMENFNTVLELKAEIFELDMTQDTHTFTNSTGDKRITLGRYMNDNYRDTVNEGIALVKEAISKLATDKNSQALVNAVFRLLAKDQQGNLKASRVLQLKKLADESNNEKLLEGVRIIQDAYQPVESKQFIRAEYKGKNGEWISIPLGMTEA